MKLRYIIGLIPMFTSLSYAQVPLTGYLRNPYITEYTVSCKAYDDKDPSKMIAQYKGPFSKRTGGSVELSHANSNYDHLIFILDYVWDADVLRLTIADRSTGFAADTFEVTPQHMQLFQTSKDRGIIFECDFQE